MWFQQTPKKSQGELVAYIYRERGERREKMGQRKKKPWETELECKLCVLVSIPSKHLCLGLLTCCQIFLSRYQVLT